MDRTTRHRGVFSLLSYIHISLLCLHVNDIIVPAEDALENIKEPGVHKEKINLQSDPEASWLLKDANADTMWKYMITAGMDGTQQDVVEARDFFLNFERQVGTYTDQIVQNFEDFFSKFLRQGSFELRDDFQKKPVYIAGQAATQTKNLSLVEWAQEKGAIKKKFFGSKVSLGGLRSKYTGNWPFVAKSLVKQKTKNYYRLKTERGGWESGFSSNWRIKPSKKARGIQMKYLYDLIGKLLHARYPEVGFIAPSGTRTSTRRTTSSSIISTSEGGRDDDLLLGKKEKEQKMEMIDVEDDEDDKTNVVALDGLDVVN